MRLSQKRKTILYDAIKVPIIDLRIAQWEGITVEEMDLRLFELEVEIWSRISLALKIDG
jgi:hypothetical protein